MKILRTFEEILDYAIEQERKEVYFYRDLAGKIKNKNVNLLFNNIALEKTAHMLKLEKMKEVKKVLPVKKVIDLKIAGGIKDVDTNKKELSYQDALIVAMKREKIKFKFYLEMAKHAENEECRQTFISLANEEARHKLRFEIEYDENILQEN